MVSWQAWKNRIFGALLLGVVSAQAVAADPVLSITATPDPAVLGSPVGLNVLIGGAADLYAYQFTLNFNPSVLQVTGVSEGAFLSAGGTTFFGPGTINNTLGTISFAFNTLIGELPGVSGSGVLAHIDFSTVAAGTSALTFADVILLNSQLGEVAAQMQNRSLVVAAIPEPAALVLFGLGLAGLAVRRQLRAA